MRQEHPTMVRARSWRRRLLSLCAGVLVLSLGSMIVAIMENWPDQFDDRGRDRAMAEFVWTGTALSPPLLGLALIAWFAVATQRRDRWGGLAALGLAFVSGLMIIGGIAQAVRPPVPEVPSSVKLAGGVFHAAAFGLVFVVSLLALREAVLEDELQGTNGHQGAGGGRA